MPRALWLDRATGHATNEEGHLIGRVAFIGDCEHARLVWNEYGTLITTYGATRWEQMAWELSVRYAAQVGFAP